MHSESFRVELGRRLRLARCRRGFTQQAAGRHLGVTFQQIQKYEAGADRLSVEYLVRLQHLYGVPLTDLIPVGETETAAAPGVGRSASNLVRHFEAIESEQVRDRLALLVRSLARSDKHRAKATGASPVGRARTMGSDG